MSHWVAERSDQGNSSWQLAEGLLLNRNEAGVARPSWTRGDLPPQPLFRGKSGECCERQCVFLSLLFCEHGVIITVPANFVTSRF